MSAIALRRSVSASAPRQLTSAGGVCANSSRARSSSRMASEALDQDEQERAQVVARQVARWQILKLDDVRADHVQSLNDAADQIEQLVPAEPIACRRADRRAQQVLRKDVRVDREI